MQVRVIVGDADSDDRVPNVSAATVWPLSWIAVRSLNFTEAAF
jgi:hypothetical protein